jgi:hypothetical protein
MHTYNIKPQQIETIDAACHTTQWKPDTKIAITNTTNDAIREAQRDNTDVKVFTDGSGMEGKIGASAILYRAGRRKTSIRYNLGTQSHHTVYKGESVGMILAIKLMSREWAIRSATLCVDNQATIRATQLTKPHPGHHLTDIFHRDLKALKKKTERHTSYDQMDSGTQRNRGQRASQRTSKKSDNRGKQQHEPITAIPQKATTTKQICNQTSLQRETKTASTKSVDAITKIRPHEKP